MINDAVARLVTAWAGYSFAGKPITARRLIALARSRADLRKALNAAVPGAVRPIKVGQILSGNVNTLINGHFIRSTFDTRNKVHLWHVEKLTGEQLRRLHYEQVTRETKAASQRELYKPPATSRPQFPERFVAVSPHGQHAYTHEPTARQLAAVLTEHYLHAKVARHAGGHVIRIDGADVSTVTEVCRQVPRLAHVYIRQETTVPADRQRGAFKWDHATADWIPDPSVPQPVNHPLGYNPDLKFVRALFDESSHRPRRRTLFPWNPYDV